MCDHGGTDGPLPNCYSIPSGDIQCERKCLPEYNISYENDKHYGESYYIIEPEVSAIQEEIMTYGSVMTSFRAYEDFVTYRSGVYRHVSGAKGGMHTLKILGWGFENNTPYWLCANSWNQYWGENGYVKFLRGHDECGIETMVAAGLAKIINN